VDVNVYEGSENVLVLGMLSSLIGSTIWIFIATFANAPVSTTHSLVGGIVGFSLVARGGDGINTKQLSKSKVWCTAAAARFYVRNSHVEFLQQSILSSAGSSALL